MMQRIIIHWSGGSHKVSNLDRQHYHFIVDGEGNLIAGVHPVSANAKPVKGSYAAHTLNCNTGSIGIAVAAMAGAQEYPFSAGTHPITEKQLQGLYEACADLAREYNIPVTQKAILTHAEVQPTLGIKQRGKWDITWLPGMTGPGNPITVGDVIRKGISQCLIQPAPKPEPAKPAPKPSFWAALLSAFRRKT